ncbi:hypothetical protein [Sphingomonas sp. Mn802worker]|uniref:hypothetical protein n=1 Tax=Sphingomonas sp. Mn802worker TaxID=629773 RepID=UPI00035DB855|nr:hypothetical protein [Sphingomonas sp. Mn802worker]
MSNDNRKISDGPNGRPLGDSISSLGPGIPDDALAPGEVLPTPPSDEEVEACKRALGADD